MVQTGKDYRIIAIELTVPWKENCDEAHQRKSPKYTDLLADYRERGGRQYCVLYRGRMQRFPSKISMEDVSDCGNDIIV